MELFSIRIQRTFQLVSTMYQDQKAWDITRSTEVLVNLSANKLSPRKSIGENCLSCG